MPRIYESIKITEEEYKIRTNDEIKQELKDYIDTEGIL